MSDAETAIRLAALQAAHEACHAQRDEEGALLRRVADDVAEIKTTLGRIPWRVLTGNGVPPIDIRVDRVERSVWWLVRVGWALAGSVGAAALALIVEWAKTRGGTP